MKKQILHAVYRIVVILFLVFIPYIIILNSSPGHMGIEVLYIFAPAFIIAPIFLIIEAIIISKKAKKTEATINWMIAIILVVILLSFLNMK